MIAVLKEIKDAAAVFQGTGHYLALFLVAVVYMMINKNEDRNRNFYLYSICSLLIISIPFTALDIMKLLGLENNYYIAFYILPIYVLVPYIGTRFLEECKKWREKLSVCIVYVLILILVGSYNYQNNYFTTLTWSNNKLEVSEEIKNISYLLADYDYVKAIVPKEVCEQIKEYDTHIKLLYGSDIIEGRLSNKNNAEEQRLRLIYQDIASAPESFEKIAGWAQQCECNCIIQKREYQDDETAQVLGYQCVGETENYLIYMNM